MRIVLVRHGRPEGVSTALIPGRAIGDWVRRYDAVGVAQDVAPPPTARELASAAACIVASDLRRARESAEWLAPTRSIILDAGLREAPLPESLGIALRLSPGAWIVIARLAWFLNWGGASETATATRVRAVRIADRLAALAAEHESVMAVGHGIFNRFLARELRRRGWRGPRRFPPGYWGVAEFEHDIAAARQG
jgi:broad specificity phosphatase PhoE